MRTRHIRAAFLAVLAAFPLLFGCEDEVKDEKLDDTPREFTATIGVDTKTLLGGEYDSSGDQKRQLLWSLNDEVVVGGSIYRATGLSTDAGTALLSGSGAMKEGTVYKAYYPKGIYGKSGNTVTLTLPGKPGYAGLAGGRVIASNLPMYAQSENTQLRFHNLCAVLNFRLTGTDKVEKIVIKSKTRRLWGTFEIDGSETAGWYAKVPSGGTPTDEEKCVTLLCDKAQLDVTDPTEFCIALPEYTYPQGDLSVEVWSETEIIATLNNDGAGSSGSELKRNTIYKIEKETKLTVSELELDKSSDTKWVGDDNGAAITVSTKTVTYSNGSKENNPAADSWTNSNTNAVTMTIAADKKSVTLLPKAAGTAVITAKIGDKEASYTLNVNELKQVVVKPATASVYTGKTQVFEAEVTYRLHNSTKDASGVPNGWNGVWTRSAGTAATIPANTTATKVTATAGTTAGSATFRYTVSRSGNNKPMYEEGALTVTALSATNLELDKASDTKWVGDDNGAAIKVSTKTAKYNDNSTVNNPAADSWTNSNTNAVTMTIAADKKSVTLLPKAAGTAVITAKIGDRTATYKLMVNKLNSVTISPNSTATVYITDQRTFTPKYSWTRYDGQPQTTKPDGWSQAWTPTATTGVVSVAASGNNGVMTARKVSNANNTVKLTLSRTNNSAPKSGTYNVKVADLTATVTANPTSFKAGQSTTGTATLKKGSQTLTPTYAWTLSSGLTGSSKTNTIKATAGNSTGTRTLTCTMTYTANGVTVTKKPSATVTVTANNIPTSVTPSDEAVLNNAWVIGYTSTTGWRTKTATVSFTAKNTFGANISGVTWSYSVAYRNGWEGSGFGITPNGNSLTISFGGQGSNGDTTTYWTLTVKATAGGTTYTKTYTLTGTLLRGNPYGY